MENTQEELQFERDFEEGELTYQQTKEYRNFQARQYLEVENREFRNNLINYD